MRATLGERVRAGLPEVNRQAVVRQLVRLAGRAMATFTVTGERSRP
jgi:hypothetical protein